MIHHRNFKEDYNNSSRYSRKLISGKVTATAGIRNPHNLQLVYGSAANRIEVLRALEKQNRFRIIWYTLFILLGLACLIIEPASWFYVLDLLVILINVDLASQGKLIGIYVGVFECFMYAYICFISGLYGEVIKMFVINVPLNIFTIVSWTKNLKEQQNHSYKKQEEDNSVTIRKLDFSSISWITPTFVALYVGSYFGLKLLNTSALIFSAAALACTIFNKLLNGLRFKESWWFSIATNIISTGMWVQVMLSGTSNGISLVELPALLSTFACLANSFYGYALWKSMYRKIAVNGGEILSVRKIRIKKIIKLRRQYQKLYWNKEIDSSKN